MNRLFYVKIAKTNLKRNNKMYVPYILTCIGVIMMFYNTCALALHQGVGGGSLSLVMQIGTTVTGIFSAIFLFYTYSFLVKRRQKELGLFNILGMEKKHLAKVMWWENIMLATVGITVGLFLGIVFNKLITLFLYKLLHFDPHFQFTISLAACVRTILLFVLIFTLTLLSSIYQVYKAKPIELLRAENVGEKEPKVNWMVAVLGMVTLGSGYWLALAAKNPLEVLGLFFVAVLLVIVGTYCLFTAGSIALLKGLKRNKAYYYQTKHFVALSGMLYRMKQNAVGLASICCIATAVLVMVSTTVSLYVGLEDLINHRFPNDAMITLRYTPENRPNIGEIATNIQAIMQQDQMVYEDFRHYEFVEIDASKKGNVYEELQDSWATGEGVTTVLAMTQQDYARIVGEVLSLKEGEVALYGKHKETEITLLNQTYQVANFLEAVPPIAPFSTWLVDVLYVVVADQAALDTLYSVQQYDDVEMGGGIYTEIIFDFKAADEVVKAYCEERFIPQLAKEDTLATTRYGSIIKQLSEGEFYEVYGALFFLGVFLGILFLMATVLIIYYKQIVEGFEDKERYHIMQQVGMSREEVKKSIQSQILTVFGLPIAMAIVHIIVAFPILTKLLALLNLTNKTLFLQGTIITVILFVLLYGAVYQLTAKVYHKIVSS